MALLQKASSGKMEKGSSIWMPTWSSCVIHVQVHVQVQVKIVHTLGSFGRSFGSGMVFTVSCILNTYYLTYYLYLTSSMPKRKKEMMNSAGMVAQ